MYHGRRKPYTVIGIKRIPCCHCGKPSVHQWQICANDGLYLTLCEECDIEVNRWALEFMKIPNADQLMEKYKQG